VVLAEVRHRLQHGRPAAVDRAFREGVAPAGQQVLHPAEQEEEHDDEEDAREERQERAAAVDDDDRLAAAAAAAAVAPDDGLVAPDAWDAHEGRVPRHAAG
jgi:hypothetical protein